jgi:toxin-antitoxin system PIN domain toxin
VIVPDINLLLYANIAGFPQHAAARGWWEGLLGDDSEVGLPLPTVFGFLRLATSARVFDRPIPMEDALGRVEAWLARSQVRVLLPGPRHLEIAFRLLRAMGTAKDLTTDVQLAALAIEYQAELHSNDADFARFAQLRWVNPLV